MRSLDPAQLTADHEFAAALASGAPLTYDDAAPLPALPPPGTPVMVVRPVRLPSEVDTAVKELAARQGVTPSALIRAWVESALGGDADPATELRRGLELAQRAAAALTADHRRSAA